MQKIFLGGKHGSVIGNYALVDDEDFEWLNKYNWSALLSSGVIYARTMIPVSDTCDKRRAIRMHVLIMPDVNNGKERDHKNGNGLDNQRHNIRVASKSENTCNRGGCKTKISKSKYKGVTNYLADEKYLFWKSQICKNGKSIQKNFHSEIEAAKWYNEMALKLHGEFARLNVIE